MQEVCPEVRPDFASVCKDQQTKIPLSPERSHLAHLIRPVFTPIGTADTYDRNMASASGLKYNEMGGLWVV